MLLLPKRLLLSAASLALIAACTPSDEEPVRDAPADFIEDETYGDAETIEFEELVEPEPEAALETAEQGEEHDHDHDEEPSEDHDEHDHEAHTDHDHEAHSEDEDHDHHAHDHAGGEAHVHGLADMAISLEGDNLIVTFDSPLGNMISFEYEPTTDEERAELEALQDVFSAPDALLTLPSRLGCELRSVSSSPRHSGDHGNLMVEQDFTCASPRRPDSIDLVVFNQFPALEQIAVVYLDDESQVAAELSQDQTVLVFE